MVRLTERVSTCGLSPCPGARGEDEEGGGQQSRFSFPVRYKMMSSGAFLRATLTVHTGEMSTAASPTIPSSLLTSDQLTVLAASCK